MPTFELQKRLLLIVMDGVGVAKNSIGNAVTQSQPENLIKLWSANPHTYLRASSEAVGLPPLTNGNSEVGHLNIGAGRVMYQNLPKINKAIDSGNIFTNEMLTKALQHAVTFNSDIHLLGNFSDGSIHSHIKHFEAVTEFYARKDFKGNVYLHAFSDGRDAPPKSIETYIKRYETKCAEIKLGRIASICGRAFAMDRNKTWRRTQMAYNMLVKSEGQKYSSAQDAVKAAYNRNETDEFISPSIIVKSNVVPRIKENDCVLFMNFRADRAMQLCKAFTDKSFSEFEVIKFTNLFVASIVEYERNYPEKVIFPKEYIKLPLGRVIAEEGLRQLRIAESEKFPHVTYFFNGGISLKYPGEDRIEIPSPSVPTYDMKPEMSAFELLAALSERIKNDTYNFTVLNLANGDMVGHSGNISASIKAMKVVDFCVAKLVEQMIARDGTVVITADHGNAEELINRETGGVDTEHSQNVVPFIVINKHLPQTRMPFGSLSDIAPTILKLMGITKPSEMTGQSLI